MTVETEPGMPPDEQEARSIRYVSGLRLALLTSGNWACWFESQDRSTLAIIEAKDFSVAWVELFARREREERELGWSKYQARRDRLLLDEIERQNAPPVQQASRNIEDLGL